MKKRIFRSVVACLIACFVFIGLMVTEDIHAGGPTNHDKVGAQELKFGSYKIGHTIGTTSTETNSEYFKFETKRRYNVQVTLVAEYETTDKFDIQVFDESGICVKSTNNTKNGWSFNKEKNHSVNTFVINKLKKGTYYIEVTEHNANKDIKFSVKVVPMMTSKVKGVSANQVAAGQKKVTISWTPISGAAISGYKIYRATKKNGKYKLVATVKGKKKSQKTVNQKLGKTFYYKVRAYDTASSKYVTLYSKYSAAVKVKTAK